MNSKVAISRLTVGAAVLVLVTVVYIRLLPVNPTTVALTFLVLVLLASAFWGFRIALVISIAATALFNFFFLPPVGTFTIADPQNWVALFTFLITAIVASNLAERARRQAELAQQRRLEVERLYSLSQQLLATDDTLQLFNSLPAKIVEIFGASGAALQVSGRDTVYLSRPDFAFEAGLLEATNTRGEPSQVGDVSYVPLRIGVKPAGAMAIAGVQLSRGSMDAVGSLVGMAAERTRAIEELANNRAAQENEKLRVALLDSVTHEFRTPLTSIKASVTGLLEENILDPAERHDLLTVIDEETDRLNRLVGEAAEMAQLDAQMVRLERSPHAVKDVIDAAIESARIPLKSHTVQVDVPDAVGKSAFDFGRIREVLTHLLENAAKYSPLSRPIRVSAERTPIEIIINVADQGTGIDPTEQSLIFEKFYRGREQRVMAHGTGMGLAISDVIVKAHGGRISLVSQIGAGSVFSVHLPVDTRR
jgi:two-component system sensor histidine kinase KdpD